MTTWRSDHILVNDIKIHYYRTGGDKPSLVLCHGLTSNGLTWTRVAQALEKDYDVIMIDARGQGFSDAPETGYRVEDHANDVVGVIEALQLDHPHLIGHSMGASTVAAVVAEYPNLVGHALLEDPPWYDVSMSVEEREKVAKEWRTDLIERKSMSHEELMALGRNEHPLWDDIEFGPWLEAIAQANPSCINFVTEVGAPWREIITKINSPTLLITGDVDAGGIITPEVAKEITKLQPNIQVTHIGDTGHQIRRDQFKQFIEVVKDFLPQ